MEEGAKEFVCEQVCGVVSPQAKKRTRDLTYAVYGWPTVSSYKTTDFKVLKTGNEEIIHRRQWSRNVY